MKPMHDLHLSGSVTFKTETGELVNEPRIRLLEAIEAIGSLSQAAKAVPMSYKTAWEAIEHMNRVAGCPVVERSVGGRNGGGTELTEQGRRLIALYRSVERQCQSTIGELVSHLRQGGTPLNFRYLMRRREWTDKSGSNARYGNLAWRGQPC